MKILHLTLHRQWFDAIASGHKTEEYRAMTPHWHSRLAGRNYDEVHFRNGYATDAPFMRVQCLGITTGSRQWKPCYVIRLGAILETRNYSTSPAVCQPDQTAPLAPSVAC